MQKSRQQNYKVTGDKTKERGLHFEMLGKKSQNTLELFLVVIYIHRVQSDLQIWQG